MIRLDGFPVGEEEPVVERRRTPPASPERSVTPASAGSGSTGGTSPGSTCAICLSRLTNRAFADTCLHEFCFECLVEWANVKAECPLCKQGFRSIMHNVRTPADYDRHFLPSAPRQPFPAPSGGVRLLSFGAISWDGLRMMQRMRAEDRQMRLNRINSFRNTVRSLSGANNSRWGSQQQTVQETVHQTVEFRRSLYRNGLWCERVMSVNGEVRYREATATFFRLNPACTHRLAPWLHRELLALFPSDGTSTVPFLMELIMGLVKQHDIPSSDFRQRLEPFIGRNLDMFIHELYMFARCPYDMAAFDRHAVYPRPLPAPRPPVVQSISSRSASERNYDLRSVSSSSSSHAVYIADSSEDDADPVSSAARRQPSRSSNAIVAGAGVSYQPLSRPALSNVPQAPRQYNIASAGMQPIEERVQTFLASLKGTSRPAAPASRCNQVAVGQCGASSYGSTLPASAGSSAALPTSSALSPMGLPGPSGLQGGCAQNHDSDGDSSEVIFVKEEKPWRDRTPVLLSSDLSDAESGECLPIASARSDRRGSGLATNDRRDHLSASAASTADSGSLHHLHHTVRRSGAGRWPSRTPVRRARTDCKGRGSRSPVGFSRNRGEGHRSRSPVSTAVTSHHSGNPVGTHRQMGSARRSRSPIASARIDRRDSHLHPSESGSGRRILLSARNRSRSRNRIRLSRRSHGSRSRASSSTPEREGARSRSRSPCNGRMLMSFHRKSRKQHHHRDRHSSAYFSTDRERSNSVSKDTTHRRRKGHCSSSRHRRNDHSSKRKRHGHSHSHRSSSRKRVSSRHEHISSANRAYSGCYGDVARSRSREKDRSMHRERRSSKKTFPGHEGSDWTDNAF